ncbi:MAG: HAD-IA family hydrolase [Spirochaetales bacterium]|nr:HAD-IA family hydrolase [Spirochaetales bacterium]MCF7938478.1 HAD-IA family hydrolase [Spirochaetales bacterium]
MSSSNKNPVIFDLDGTLLNTLGDIAAAVNTMLSSRGYEGYSQESYKQMVGHGMRNLVISALPPDASSDEEEINSALEEMMDYYRAHPADYTQPYPGIYEMLEKLAADSVPMAIYSNKADELVQRAVSLRLEGIPFKAVRGAKPGAPKKPDPYVALELARSLGSEPPRIWYLGDSGVDMQTAVHAGMRAVGVLWGFRGRKELSEAGAEHLIESPDQFLQLY